jgi:hypothetical protein
MNDLSCMSVRRRGFAARHAQIRDHHGFARVDDFARNSFTNTHWPNRFAGSVAQSAGCFQINSFALSSNTITRRVPIAAAPSKLLMIEL